MTPWTATCQALLYSAISWNLLRFLFIELVMLSNHLILHHPLLLLALIFPQHKGLFQWVSSLCQVAKVVELQLQHQSFLSGLLSFGTDWFDFFPVQGTFKSLLQHHDSKASTFWCSAFLMVQLAPAYVTTGETIALNIWTFVGKGMSLLICYLGLS